LGGGSPPPGGGGGGGGGGGHWPESAQEVSSDQLRECLVDLVVLQRPEEIAEAGRLLGRRAGRDVPAIYVEHNTPRTDVPESVHPLADRSDITIAHVTHFNDLFWDSGKARTVVIEHGIVDPGQLYTGTERALAVVINEPVRRWRVTGTDLLPIFAELARVDVFGMGGRALTDRFGATSQIRPCGDLAPAELHSAVAARRVYLHPNRWTSLGLALLEAMHLGMPVLALATTEVMRAVPPEAGAVSTDLRELVAAAKCLLDDPDEARRRGAVARQVVVQRHGLQRFLNRWDEILADEVTAFASRRAGRSAGQHTLRRAPTVPNLERANQ
jgi:glycosyltransferase involved in cell wall biosynthesis